MRYAPFLLSALVSSAAAGVVELPARPVVSVSGAPIPAFSPDFAPSLSPMTAPSLSALAPMPPAAAASPFSPAPLDLSPAAGVYERRGVGLLVLDAKDSTALHLSEGTRRAHAMIRRTIDDAESAASAFDGRVIRRLGDGSLIAFPSYGAALGAAEAIQRGNAARRERGEAGPELRVGVNVGRVLVDATGAAPEIYGHPVEKALALAAQAEGGAVAREAGALGVPLAPVRPPDAPRSIDSLRVEHAATMFAGLEGFSPAYERFGRRRAYSAVKVFHAYVRETVERHGGVVVKTEGETVMASFPSAAAGVRAAAEIQSRMERLRKAAPLGAAFKPRVGLSWGRVIREERDGEVDYFGNTVNAAARLMRQSGDGEILVSGTAAAERGVMGQLKGGRVERARLKGFGDFVRVVRFSPAPAPPNTAEEGRLREIAREARARIVPAD